MIYLFLSDARIFFLMRKDSVNNPKAVKEDISRTDLYVQEWNEKVNISSKGKQYLLKTISISKSIL